MKNLSTNNQFKPQGMAGFFGWLRRTVGNVINAVSEVSRNPLFLANIAVDALNGGSFTIGNGTTVDDVMQFFDINRQSNTSLTDFSSLNQLDEQKLDLWVSSNFMPYYMTFFIRTKQMAMVSTSMNKIIEIANEAELFISLLQWNNTYVLINGDPNFSNNAVVSRAEFIEVQIKILRAEMEDFINSRGVLVKRSNVTKSVFKSDNAFLNLNMPDSINVSVRHYGDYVSGNILLNQNGNADQGENTNDIGNAGLDNQNNPVNNNDGATTSKSSNLLLLALIGLGVYVIANSSDEDEKDSDKVAKLTKALAKKTVKKEA